MSRGGQIVAVVLLLVCDSAWATIVVARIERDDRSLIPITEAFGFASNGHIDLALSDIEVYQPLALPRQPDPDNFGFFLMAADAGLLLDQDILEQKCLLSARENKLFTFADRNVQKLLTKENTVYSFHVELENGGLFYLYFANCEEHTPVSLTIRVEMFNMRRDGKKDYLSVGETELDAVYWVMFTLFTGLAAAWAVVLHRGRANSSVHAIHWLMLALVVAKSLTLMALAAMTYYVRVTGSADGWDIVYYAFTFLRGTLFFVVIALIGTGWSYMKPFIDDNTKRVLLVVVPLQVFANLALVIVDEESPALRDWMTWRDLLHLLDLACCAAVLFPIVWSIKHLREASQTDGKAARSLAKLTLFRSFYLSVIVYIYFTRIVVYLLASTVNYTHAWTTTAAAELAALAFYMWVGVRFRPHKENQYLKLQHDEIEL